MARPPLPGVGDTIPTLRVDDIDADKIKIMALVLRDPNPIHFDLDAVREAGLGDRVVNQGGVTMSYIVNMLATWTGSRAAIRNIDCRFNANVFAGDSVEVGGTVTEVRQVDGETLADCEVWVRNDGAADPRPVVGGTATVALRQ